MHGAEHEHERETFISAVKVRHKLNLTMFGYLTTLSQPEAIISLNNCQVESR